MTDNKERARLAAAGHGYIVPRTDGGKARCGGPAVCPVCQAERAALAASQEKAEPVALRKTFEEWLGEVVADGGCTVEALLVGDTDPIRCARSAWDACVASLYAAPVAAQASEPVTYDWRVALVVSSSDPNKQVLWLADGAAEIARVEQHSSFIRWLDTPQPSAEAVRDAALEEAAKAIEDHQRKGREWVPGSLWGTLSREAAARIRALKSAPPQPAEQPSASPVYDKSIVKRLATQMGWTPPSASPAEQPSASPAALEAELIAALRWAIDEAHARQLAGIAGPLSRILARAQGEQA